MSRICLWYCIFYHLTDFSGVEMPAASFRLHPCVAEKETPDSKVKQPEPTIQLKSNNENIVISI